MFYSIIVPAFKRHDEIEEFLTSLCKQAYTNFEVLIVDGSPDDSLKNVVQKFADKLDVHYHFIKGLGISDARNLGCQKAKGEYFVFMDSDVIVPEQYLEEVEKSQKINFLDAYGGPDAAHASFSNIQKAVNYAMTSTLTTGGIRGGKKHVGKFHARGFNMGMSRKVFEITGGYSNLKVSEDIDLSIRIIQAGFKTGLIPKAFVYHKRRTSFFHFYKQTRTFGSGRIDLFLKYKNELKLTHIFPAAYLIYFLLCLAAPFLFTIWWHASLFALPIYLYNCLILVNSIEQYGNIIIGILSVIAVNTMFFGYGIGLIQNFIRRIIFNQKSSSKKGYSSE